MDDSREKFEEFVRRAFSTTDYTMARDHDGLYYNRVWRDEKGLSGVADVSALWMAWSAGRASAAAERDALLLDCRSFLLEEQKLKAERDALRAKLDSVRDVAVLMLDAIRLIEEGKPLPIEYMKTKLRATINAALRGEEE